MSPRTGRPTNDPKGIQLNLRISQEYQRKLDYCSEAYKASKGEIVRRGIEAMYNQADYVKKMREERDEWETFISKAEKRRIHEIREEVYDPAFREAYAEKFAELIRDPNYTCRSDVVAHATAYAKDIAESAVDDAVDNFINS